MLISKKLGTMSQISKNTFVEFILKLIHAKVFSIKRKSYSIETKYQVVEMKVDEYNLKQLWNH